MQTFVLAREKEAWLCGRLIKHRHYNHCHHHHHRHHHHTTIIVTITTIVIITITEKRRHCCVVAFWESVKPLFAESVHTEGGWNYPPNLQKNIDFIEGIKTWAAHSPSLSFTLTRIRAAPQPVV